MSKRVALKTLLIIASLPWFAVSAPACGTAVNLPQSVNLAFDNNGNLTNDGTRAFFYNTENQLTNVSVLGQWRSDFVYDGLGRRRIVREYAWTGSWVETNEVHIVYDGYLPIQERDSNNNVLVTYTRGLDLSGSLHGAGGIGGLLARTDTNGSTYYHSDGAGNITALMDGQEDIAARYMYGPFGKLVGQWGAMANANEMQFSSMPRDSLSGLSFYPFRAYEPNFQRWINQDPIQEWGGINLYRFIANDPVNRTDGFGFSPMAGDDVYVAAVAAGSDENAVQQAVADQLAVDSAGDTMTAGAVAATATTAAIAVAAPEGLPAWAAYLWAAGAGAAGGYVGNGVQNELNGQPFNQNGGIAAATGAALGAAGRALGSALRPKITCPQKPLTGPEAARAALGKGPNANPGAPLTPEMKAALKQNLAAAQNSLNMAKQGLTPGGTPASPAQVQAQIATTTARINAINSALQSGVQAPKN